MHSSIMPRTACFNGHLYQAGGGCPVGYSGRGRHPPGPRCRHLPDPEADTLPGPRRRHPPRPRGRHHPPVNDRCKNMHSSRMRRTACFNGHLYCYIGIDLDLSKPKGMPLNLKLHTYSFTTKYINMAKA